MEIMADKDAEIQSNPLLLEAPKAAAVTDAPTIELEAVHSAHADEKPSAETAAAEQPAAEQASRWRLATYAPLAATITFALALGAIAGAAATSGLLHDSSPSPATTEASRALQASVTQLGNELATVKASIASAQKTSGVQFGKLTERLDRTDKAQAEPALKLAKIQESIERLERRQQVAAQPAPEITGSVTPPKEESKPQVVEGWRLRDFYDGRAIVENRTGTLFRVGPGSNVPGLGRIESIKRENGKVVVVTPSGIIAASLEPRRPGYYRW
jgi:hypothetical protein